MTEAEIERIAGQIAARIAAGRRAPTPPPAIEATIGLADRAVARIDRQGLRGVTLCSVAEIEAMALVIALSGATHLLAAAMAAPTPEETRDV